MWINLSIGETYNFREWFTLTDCLIAMLSQQSREITGNGELNDSLVRGEPE